MDKTSSNFANLSCYRWDELVIGEIDEKKNSNDNNITIHCSEYNKRSFCRLVEQIDKHNNYDLQWFAHILSNVESTILSNNWPCLWSKIPLKWLLNGDN